MIFDTEKAVVLIFFANYTVRKHGSNDMLSPIEYEKRYFMKLGVV